MNDYCAQDRAEITKLERAVDDFAEAMKKRLRDKAHTGWRGWGNKKWLDAIKSRLVSNASAINSAHCEDRHPVDAANLAMMVWFQRKKSDSSQTLRQNRRFQNE